MKKFGTVIMVLVIFGGGCLPSFWPSRLSDPLPRAEARERKLTFGLYVTPDPEQNPIDPPERFTGFHAGLDLEIFPNELDEDVPVYAICEGTIAYVKEVNGYGGVVVERCELDGESVTVIYGHLDIESVVHNIQNHVDAGEQIAVLGDHKSSETSDNRKHLHLGIHKGEEIGLLGYVQEEGELEAYLDPEVVLRYRK